MSDGKPDEEGPGQLGSCAAEDPTAVWGIDEIRAAGYEQVVGGAGVESPPAMPVSISLRPSMLVQDGFDPAGPTLRPGSGVRVLSARSWGLTLTCAVVLGVVVFATVRLLG